MRTMLRTASRRIWFIGTLATVLMAGGLGSVTSVTAASADPAVVGSWSAEIPIGVIGIHAAIMPSGNVFYYELPGSTESRAVLFNPTTHAVTEVDPTNLHWSVFCSGISHLANGQIFSTGGEPPHKPTKSPLGTGTQNASTFNEATQSWTALPPMAYARWYPSNVEMPNGTTLVMGGKQIPHGANFEVKAMESYNPASNTWTTLPASANITGLYPRAILLPNGNVLDAGPQRQTSEFHPATNTWTPVAKMLYGTRTAGGVVVLPGSNKILEAGGSGTATSVMKTAEILDMSAATPKWTATGSMATARKFNNLVLLPNGTVLTVGGGQVGNFGSPVKSAELYDPATGLWTTMASQAGARTYHSTALLLPDGRVISAGSNSGLPEQRTVEIYSPPYLFAGARPTVTSAPTTINYASSFDVQTPDAASIAHVALIKLGATTHGWAQDQRFNYLSFTKGTGVLHLTGPANAALAQPGYYMLFLVNANGVPSVAPIMKLS